MGYVDKNLMDDETVVYKAYIHWFIFIPGFIVESIGILLLVLSFISEDNRLFLQFVAGIFLVIGTFMLIPAWIHQMTTELAVTTKRVIAKFGFIRRNTIELNHSKVESFHVEQGILGRIFQFGTLVIYGTGGGETPIQNIDKPLEFRKKAMETIDLAD